MRALFVLNLITTLVSPAAAADRWPEFRGPHGNGHADAAGLPLTWSETENVVWKTPVHDRGWSSPVVWDDQIWLTTALENGKQSFAVCVDLDSGRIVHDVKVFETETPHRSYDFNSYASCTPVIEEGRVYVHFGSNGTACLDTATGQVLWSRTDLPCDHFRGHGSSPILFENLLIVHLDGFDLQYVVALDKQTGRTVWKRDRDIDFGTTNGDFMKAYSTPIVIEVDGRLQLVSPASKAVLAYDPRTGDELWRARYPSFSSTARPLYGLGMVFVNTGFGKADLYAIRPDGRGDATDTHVEWIQKKGVPSMTSQLLVDDLIYMVHEEGVASALDAKTGEQVWQKRVGGKHSASPLYADGRIYIFSREGETTVLEPGREYKELAVNKLDDGCMGSPAVVGRSLIVRTKSHLYRIEKAARE